MLGRRYEIPSMQSDFYRIQFRKMLRKLIFAVCFMFVLLLAIMYLIFFQPKQHYYGNTTQGKILLMPPEKVGT